MDRTRKRFERCQEKRQERNCCDSGVKFLIGPLRVQGWRSAIASVSKEKAAELRNQVESIAAASNLLGVHNRRSPYPGAVFAATGQLETLSADRIAGHASSFDLVLVDETGLMPERARELLAGLRSSVSAKAGRVIHISVRGDSPLLREVLENPSIVSRVFAAPDDCALDDPGAWRQRQAWLLAHPERVGRTACLDETSINTKMARMRGAVPEASGWLPPLPMVIGKP